MSTDYTMATKAFSFTLAKGRYGTSRFRSKVPALICFAISGLQWYEAPPTGQTDVMNHQDT